ncbi:MAG: SDR family oxidoreductase [Candidatus Omnitrophica bacterium]|nr:SDR family oxidoreductase [Candidatus Omnitrophota bacterium]MDD5671020.1 SDR family oxidoreductase [Candidatus Omnitrophota bacterium]
MKLHGRIALVTGAAQRIGREIALTLAAGGADIVVHYNRSRTEAADLKKQIEDLGRKAWLLSFNLSVRTRRFDQTLAKLLRDIHRLVPGVDILINNASVFYPVPFNRIKAEDWEAFLTVNLKAPFFLAYEMGKRMVRRGSGKIINIIDCSVSRPAADYLPYAISKAGLSTATVGLARALAPQVQVNGVAPGPILPPRGAKAGRINKIAQKTLLKRFGNPADIAEAVRFLVAGTDFVTGVVLPVDGGFSIA